MSTRYGEIESAETLLVREFTLEKKGLRLTLLDDEEIFLPRLCDSDLLQRRKLSHALAQNTLKVPEYDAPQALPLNELDSLKGYIYIGRKEESKLRVAKVLRSEKLISLDGAMVHPSKQIRYNCTLGYKIDSNK